MKQSIEYTIKKFSQLRMLVIGDAMLDMYLQGTSTRICREAPVPIVDIHNQMEVPGGAANTAMNLAQLSAHTTYLSVIGDDWEGKKLTELLKKNTIHTSKILIEKDRKTLTKQRVMAGNHMLVRFDYGSTENISKASEKKLINILIEEYEDADGVIISDYGYGILTDSVLQTLKQLIKKVPKVVVVDSKYLDKYKDLNVAAVKPNYQETTALIGLTQIPSEGNRLKDLLARGEEIFEITNARIAAVTVDIEGSVIFENGKVIHRTYTKPVENSKAAGAGDTYTSAFALALAAKTNARDAAEIAAAAARIVVQKEGTSTCNAEELFRSFSTKNKRIEQTEDLHTILQQYRHNGKKIVFTNGCFDILHPGHVDYLSRAKSLGDILIVGMNTDESISRLKGPERPINSLRDRMDVLSGLSSVDHVVPFSENTPINLIHIIKPDIYVKGGDYTRATLPEVPHVEEYGGTVEILPFVQDRSTTSIIKRIRTIPQVGYANGRQVIHMKNRE